MSEEKKTKQAFLASQILDAPFFMMYLILMFIMKKELDATAFQITLLIILKPALSLITPLWSSVIYQRPDRLRSNVILAEIIAHAPFFFFPFVQSPWYIIFAGALFQTMKRCGYPAWMELIKRNLPKQKRERIYAFGVTLSYLLNIILPLAIGFLLDDFKGSWRILFPLTASISLGTIFFMMRISIPKEIPDEKKTRPNVKEILVQPWLNTWRLVRTRPDFNRFQVGFMIGGSALMFIQPALPGYFSDVLSLNYKSIALATSAFKGIGFAITSRFWADLIRRLNIYWFCAIVTGLGAVFATFLYLAQIHVYSVFVGYLFYGVLQVGSKLSWNFSGPMFSRDEDSSIYTSVNIVTVGIRGIFAPLIGGALCSALTPIWAIGAGAAFCLLATGYFLTTPQKYIEQLKTAA